VERINDNDSVNTVAHRRYWGFSLHIVQANAVYEPEARTPDELLDRYRTLTEWSVAVAAAGAQVSVVQRFHAAARVERGVTYHFVKDPQLPWLSTKDAPKPFVDAVAARSPDVVHINGLIFPQLVAGIRQAVGHRTAIVVQHHGGEFPIRGSGLVGMWRRARWRGGLAAADALSFTAAEQAEPWREADVLGNQRIVEIVEASTTMRAVARERARASIGVSGEPAILWVGRLTTNKDPITVLAGLEQALPQLPRAHVMMVFGDDTLLAAVEERVRTSALLGARVTLTPRVPRDEMPNYYAAADVFVSGSHSEGSGYALIEAMSAGVVPVITDIPSFRVIAGECGERWTPGNADTFATALMKVCTGDLRTQSAAVRERFDRELRWEAIARRTVAEYRSILEDQRASAR
jgi:glycosyltransferase involved in cell wall biosynthesis